MVASSIGIVFAWSYVSLQLLILLVSSTLSLKSVDTANQGFFKIIKLWGKTTWKMRNVYSAFAVHIFDFMTDLLVIAEWYDAEKYASDPDGVAHVDSRLMAQVSIGILIFYKIMSSIAVYATTQHSVFRAFLQFCDFLIFEEMIIAHKKVVNKLTGSKTTTIVAANSDDNNGNNGNNDSNDNGATMTMDVSTTAKTTDVNDEPIETTMRFKYIRQLEALFESTPQAVLQLVYLMRTGEFLDVIIIISILQSILSMTNSMINADNAYMESSKFKKYKKRLPPTKEFLKHWIFRLSEISYRVGLFSLFWTVVGGLGFGILLAFEIILVTIWVSLNYYEKGESMDTESLFLTLNQIIVLPPEVILEKDEFGVSGSNSMIANICIMIGHCIFCVPCGWIILLFGRSIEGSKFYKYGTPRIGISFIEWIVIIIFGITDKDDENETNFLFTWNHGLAVFVACMIFYCIYTQFCRLMPDIRLPDNVPIRSKWGYAYLGDITELERLISPNIDAKIQFEERFNYDRFDFGTTLKGLKSWLNPHGCIGKANAFAQKASKSKQSTLLLSHDSRIQLGDDYFLASIFAKRGYGLYVLYGMLDIGNDKYDYNKDDNDEDLILQLQNCSENETKIIHEIAFSWSEYLKEKTQLGFGENRINLLDSWASKTVDESMITKEVLQYIKLFLIYCFNDLRKNYHKYQANTKFCAIYALENEQYETVKWLESQGCTVHITLYQRATKKPPNSLYSKEGAEWAEKVRKNGFDLV